MLRRVRSILHMKIPYPGGRETRKRRYARGRACTTRTPHAPLGSRRRRDQHGSRADQRSYGHDHLDEDCIIQKVLIIIVMNLISHDLDQFRKREEEVEQIVIQ